MYDEKNKLSAIMMVLVLVMAAALTGCSDKKAKEQEIQNKVSAIDTAYEAFYSGSRSCEETGSL